MANIIYIPYSNPVPFYQLDVSAVAGKNFTHLDESWFKDQIQEWQQNIQYFHKIQQTDAIRIQVLTTFDPIKLDLIDCMGQVVKSVNFQHVFTSIIGQAYLVYEATIQMADVDEGYYYFLLSAGFGDNVLRYISEPIDLQLTHQGTILYTYKNSINTLDLIYETGIEFGFRCETYIGDYKPGDKSTIYEDQILNTVELSSTPFDQFKLNIGGSYGVPDWVAKKVNMIFAHDFVLLDGKQFTRADGSKMERNSAERYPMAGWSLDIRPAINRFSQIGDTTFDDEVAVTYNIEAGIFGTMNDLPTNNQIVIIERKQ